MDSADLPIYTPYEFLHELLPQVYAQNGNPEYIVKDQRGKEIYLEIEKLENEYADLKKKYLEEEGAQDIYELSETKLEELKGVSKVLENKKYFVTESELQAFVLTNDKINQEDYVKEITKNLDELLQQGLVFYYFDTKSLNDEQIANSFRYIYKYQFLCGNINEKLTNLSVNKELYIEKIGQTIWKRQQDELLAVKNPMARITSGDINSIFISAQSEFATDDNEISISNEDFVDFENMQYAGSLNAGFINWLSSGLNTGQVLPTDYTLSTQRDVIDIYCRGQEPTVPRNLEGDTKATERYVANTKENAFTDGNRLFKKFLSSALNPLMQQKIELRWNQIYNNLVLPQMHKIPVALSLARYFKNNVPFIPNPTQIQSIQFMKNAKSGLLAYGVGVGKTASSILNVSYALDNNLSKHPLFVVPLPTYEKWIGEIQGYIQTTFTIEHTVDGERVARTFNSQKEANKFKKGKKKAKILIKENLMKGLLPHLPEIVELGNLGASYLEKIKDYTPDEAEILSKLREGREYIRNMDNEYDFKDENINATVIDYFQFLDLDEFKKSYELYLSRFEINQYGNRVSAGRTEKVKSMRQFLTSDFKSKSNEAVDINWIGINKRIRQLEYTLGTVKSFPDKTIFVCTYEALQYIGASPMDGENADDLTNATSFMGELFRELSQGDNLQEVNSFAQNTNNTIVKNLQHTLYGDLAHPKVFANELGLDYLVVDESHFFKKVFTISRGTVERGYNDSASYSRSYSDLKLDRASYYSDTTGAKKRKTAKYKTIGKGTSTARALSLYFLTRLIQFNERTETNDGSEIGGNVCHLTATPFTNSPIEVYSMLALTNYDMLRKAGFGNVEEFFDVFMKIEYDLRYKANRVIKEQVLTGYNNSPQMRNVIFYLMDYKSGDDANIKRPDKVVLPSEQLGVGTIMLPTGEQAKQIQDIKGYIRGKITYGEICDVEETADVSEMSDQELIKFISEEGSASQIEEFGSLTVLDDSLRNRAIKIVTKLLDQSGQINEEDLNYRERAVTRMMKGMGMLRQITLSPYLLQCRKASGKEPTYIDYVETSPKLMYSVSCIKKVHDYEDSIGIKRTGNVLYMNIGVNPKAVVPFGEPIGTFTNRDGDEENLYNYKEISWKNGGFEKIKQYFINRLGYGEDEVVIVSGGTSNVNKEKAKNSFLSGKATVLIGSSTISTGVDLQNNASSLFMCAFDWNPTDNEQISGRIHRQGNPRAQVRIVYPMVYDSIDPIIFQILQEKTLRIKEVWDKEGNASTLSLKDFDPSQLKKKLITDPEDKAEFWFEENSKRLTDERLVINVRLEALRDAQDDYDIFSTYFVPAKATVQVLDEFRKEEARRDGMLNVKQKISDASQDEYEDLYKEEKDDKGKVTQKLVKDAETLMIEAIAKIKREAYDYKNDPDNRYEKNGITLNVPNAEGKKDENGIVIKEPKVIPYMDLTAEQTFAKVYDWIGKSGGFFEKNEDDDEWISRLNNYVRENHSDWFEGSWISEQEVKELQERKAQIEIDYAPKIEQENNLNELIDRLKGELQEMRYADVTVETISEMEQRIAQEESNLNTLAQLTNIESGQINEINDKIEKLTGGTKMKFETYGSGFAEDINDTWRDAYRMFSKH